MHLKLYITKNGILLSTRDLGIEPETHDEGLFMWSRISSLTALNRKRCLPNLQLLTAHFHNNRYKERFGTVVKSGVRRAHSTNLKNVRCIERRQI